MDFNKLNQRQLASALGKTDRAIRDWGCPRNKDRTYSLPAVIAWMVEQAEDRAGSNPKAVSGGKWLDEYRRERYLLTRMEREQAEGELLCRNEVATLWASRVCEITSGLQGLIDRLPPLLLGKDRAAMREIIHEEIWRLRDRYARSGKHCESPETSTLRPIEAGKR